MWAKIAAVEEAVAGRPRPRVFLAEWIDPPFCPGHWIPEMIERAGGECVLGEPGEPSHPVTWEDVLAADAGADRRRPLRVRRRGGGGALGRARPARPHGRGRRRRVLLASGAAARRRGASARTPASSRCRSGPRARRDRTLTRLLSPGGNTLPHGRTTTFTTRRARLARRAGDRRVHSRLRRRIEGDDRRRSGPNHDRGGRAELRPHARADRGPVLPRPRSRARGHHRGSRRRAASAAGARRRRLELRAAEGRRGRRLALRRRGRLLRRRRRRGHLPARHPDDRLGQASPSSRPCIPAGTWAAPSTCT